MKNVMRNLVNNKLITSTSALTHIQEMKQLTKNFITLNSRCTVNHFEKSRGSWLLTKSRFRGKTKMAISREIKQAIHCSRKIIGRM